MKPLHPNKLYHKCDLNLFDFKTTQTLEFSQHIVGQERALEAIDLSANIKQEGFNLFAMGPSGSGKHSVITRYLEEKAKEAPNIDDWCYVNNFKDPLKPIAIRLRSGQAAIFKKELDESIDILTRMIPELFESDEYRNAKNVIAQKYIEMQDALFMDLQNKAKEYGIAIKTSTSKRVTFAPIVNGKVLSSSEFQALKGEEKEKINANMNAFEELVSRALYRVGELGKEMQKEFKTLDKQMSSDVVHIVIAELLNTFSDVPKIVSYLYALQEDVINNVRDFLIKPDETGLPAFLASYYMPSLTRYKVNILISHETDEAGRQEHVIFENNPTHQNIIGRIEHTSHMGMLTTDFSMIRPGALHKANGGYLIIDAIKLLVEPFAWEVLKRTLQTKTIKIESIAQKYSLISTVTLEPEPIPLETKIVLIGERVLYYLLYHYDPEFKELFKVVADFEEEVERTDENVRLYANLIGSLAKRNSLLPLNKKAVARVIEYASRHAESASKLSTHLGTLSDLLKEADYYAQIKKKDEIDKEEIEKTLLAQENRQDRVQRKLYEEIDNGTLMISTTGEVIGQINALAVISLGGYRFATPARITAQTRMGKGEIIDIDRQVDLSGPIHSKGVLILSSFLGAKYAYESPLSLSVSLAFEQSYGLIDGDSASSAELYAVLSSLSKLPIKQNFAVTGSVNQFGEVQAIGGVNEKIEGFFDLAKKMHPDQEHAVLIPEANVKHLMLKEAVIEAVRNKSFAIYAIKTVDEGISILTGIDAGTKDKKGDYPKESVNGRVAKQLSAFTEAFIQLQKKAKNGD